MNEPLVSVILPVFNAGKQLEEAIESILNQTIQNLELIIINVGSTDDSLDIIKTFAHKDRRIRFISRPNKGLVFTLNELVELAEGEYIARQDSDDISMPKRLEKQISFLRQHPRVGFVGSNIVVIDNMSNRVSKRVANVDFLTHPDDLKLAEVFSNQFAHGSIVMRASVMKGLKYDPDYKHAEDYDLWARLSRASMMANLKEPLYYWRLHGKGVTSTYSSEMTNQALKIAQREFKYYLSHKNEYKFFSFHPFSMRSGVKAYLHRKSAIYRDMAILYCRSGMRRRALPIIVVATLHTPWVSQNYLQFLITLRSRDKAIDLNYELF